MKIVALFHYESPEESGYLIPVGVCAESALREHLDCKDRDSGWLTDGCRFFPDHEMPEEAAWVLSLIQVEGLLPILREVQTYDFSRSADGSYKGRIGNAIVSIDLLFETGREEWAPLNPRQVERLINLFENSSTAGSIHLDRTFGERRAWAIN